MIRGSPTHNTTYGSTDGSDTKSMRNLGGSQSTPGTGTDSGMEPHGSQSPFLSPFVNAHGHDIQSPSDTDCSMYNTSTEDFACGKDKRFVDVFSFFQFYTFYDNKS